MRKALLLIFILFVLNSCGHVESGQYIQLTPEDSLSALSKEFNLPEWQLRESNKGKSFKQGEWVFIPLQRGLASNLKKRTPASYTANMIGDYDFMWPVPASKRISSAFGRRWGKHHEGIDIPAHRGAHIVAANDGVVVYSGDKMGGYGNITVIAHPDGLFSIYAHASRNYTRKGQKVYRGQVIATVGSTGRSTGNHLHFEIRKNSKALNPKNFVSMK